MKSLNRILKSKYWWIFLLIAVVLINYLASLFHARFDLTKEKRYTLSKATKDLVKNLDDELQIDVFLKGDFPAGFKKLAASTREFLDLLKDRNSSRINYRFISPLEEISGANKLYGDSLVALGAIPINLTVQKKSGQTTNLLFPVAVVNYKGKRSLVNLYPGSSRNTSQQETNAAEALLEYQFAHAIYKLSETTQQGIAYSTGNGEPTDQRTFDLSQVLSEDFQFGQIDLNKVARIPNGVNILMIVKPTKPFSESAKLKIDQFVMNGGRLICFIDNLIAEQDSLAMVPQTIAYDRNLNLTDLFFKYGVRINTDLIMDLQCDLLPFVVGGSSDNPQIEYLQWNYYPLLIPASDKIGRNQGYIAAKFVNSVDTIKAENVRKHPLLVSSPNSRIISTPALISLNENKNVPEDEKFRKNAIPAGMLLEGTFTSLYSNRITQAQQDSLKAAGLSFKQTSVENKIMVIADGDIVFNEYVRSENENSQPSPIPMGWNKYTYTEYLQEREAGRLFIPVSNREFVRNCVEYLVNNPAINETRNKNIVLRLLDSKKLSAQKSTWQFINIGIPIILILLAGLIYQQVRRRKYNY